MLSDDTTKSAAVAPDDRWSVRVELSEDELVGLYARGLTRGALVWRSDMPEWRPLLNTPELSGRLMHTRIALKSVTDESLVDEVTLPRPARLPNDLAVNDRAADGDGGVPTVAPTALDVAAPSSSRRRGELLLVAAFSFGFAWFLRGTPEPPRAGETSQPSAAAAPTLPAVKAVTSPVQASLIPIVALTDLPLLPAPGWSSGRSASPPTKLTRESAETRPTRAALASALNQVASVASGCGERAGPVRVIISFASSGVARSIKVSGADLPSLTRSCILGAASRARVPAFSGESVTVAKTL